jgi:hypothetical protein
MFAINSIKECESYQILNEDQKQNVNHTAAFYSQRRFFNFSVCVQQLFEPNCVGL